LTKRASSGLKQNCQILISIWHDYRGRAMC
jgi:hypothetical protein